VAVTVALALGAGKVEEKMGDTATVPEDTVESTQQESAEEEGIPEVALEQNFDSSMYTLMATYYNALATGDLDTILSISNYMDETEMIWNQQLSKYIESYPLIEIYTKPGPVENSYIAYVYTHVTFYGHEERVPGLKAFYVCTDEEGKLYMNEGENPDEVLEYIKTVSLQVDVVELNNKVNAEYNELLLNNDVLFDYLAELDKELTRVTGEILAERNAEADAEQNPQAGDGEGNQDGEAGTEAPAEQTALYAVATTTVNVRSSGSEQADKLGKVAEGEQIRVIEHQANGWSKVVFEGKDGYVKSEYLQSVGENNSSGTVAVRTVKATTNVNLRKEASQSSEKLGVIAGGDTLELLSEANGWSQVRYNGMVGFVKSTYVQ
jgi:uncharacterized protein YgiM (DUF1202 family)